LPVWADAIRATARIAMIKGAFFIKSTRFFQA
jgi:hypothetical protein